MGACYLELGDADAAIEHLTRARRAYDGNTNLDASILAFLARAMLMKQDRPRARAYATRAIDVLRPRAPGGVSPSTHHLAMAEAVLAEVAIDAVAESEPIRE